MLANKIFHKAIVLAAIAILAWLGCEKLGRKSPTASDSAADAQALGKSSMPASLSSSPDIIVNTTSDIADFGGAQQVGDLPGVDGVVSLREAIIAANNTSGPQVIGFNIPTSDAGFDGTVFTVKPLSSLPNFSDDGTTLDGATQTAFTGNTNHKGPEIVLNGSLQTGAGLEINSADNVINSLVINGFLGGHAGISIQHTGADNNVISRCFVGLSAAGDVAVPNDGAGIALSSGAENNRVLWNVVSGNVAEGVAFFEFLGHATQNNIVQGNFIGTDVTGKKAMGNGRVGIGIIPGSGSISNNSIENNLIHGNYFDGISFGGGSQFGPTNGNLVKDNVISGNGAIGIAISGQAIGNTLTRNLIFSNGQHGIDLGADDVTPNDPGDTDTGANNLMNFPVLTSAKATPGQLIVKGTIDTPDPESVTIEFFANPVPTPGGDPSGHGEGEIFLGTKKPNAQGKFTATLPPVAPGTLITATATDAAGNTSEFAANIVAQ